MGRADSPLRDRVVFLVGARRSGTNWLRRIVDAHPDVVVIPPETYLLAGIVPFLERFHHGAIGSARTGFLHADPDDLHDSVRDLLDSVLLPVARAQGLTEAGMLAERTPDHVRNLDVVADVYPDARVIHIIRDGRDVARSLRSQGWGDLTSAIVEWRTAVEAGRAAAGRLEHYLEVRYEDLLADVPAGLRQLYDFLGVTADDDVARAAAVEAGVRYNVDPSARSVGSGKWSEDFDAADLEVVETWAGALLTELGYRGDGGGVRRPEPDGSVPGKVGAGFGLGLWAKRAMARLRDLVGGARVPGRLRRPRGASSGDAARVNLEHLDRAQIVNDVVLAGLATGDLACLSEVCREDASYRVVHPDGPGWSGRGPQAGARWAAEVLADRSELGRQVRGDVHPAIPTYTYSLGFRMGDGLAERTLVVTLGGQRLSELTWYRHGGPGGSAVG